MHGRARVSVKDQNSDAGAKEAAKDRRRASQYAEQLAEVLKNHKERNYGKEATGKCTALLKTNPDMYTAWNYRKSALTVLFKEADAVGKASLFEQELLLVFEALQVNPKAYGAWYHRKWILELMGAHAPLEKEFKLVDKLLTLDERNFHGWDYRRFLVKKAGAPEAQEMAFARKKIDETFSNFSAWHYRSKLLAKMHLSGGATTTGMEVASAWLEPEFELVDEAVYTDHNDTSAWIYQTWLLQNTVPDPGPILAGLWPPSGSSVPIVKPPNPSTKPLTFPAVLLFSKPVTGVNKHTAPVTVQAPGTDGRSSQEWMPVGSREGAAKIWVQELPVIDGSEARVHVGVGPGIRTPAGVQVVRSISSSFTVRMVDSQDPEAVCLHEEDEWSSQLGGASSNSQVEALRGSKGARPLPDYAATVVPGRETGGVDTGWRGNLFVRQLERRREQEELEEGNSKWALLGKARLLSAMRRLSGNKSADASLEEVEDAYKKLVELDPAHAEYYWEELGRLQLEAVTADRSALSARGVPCSWNGKPSVQLRLSHLSLRRLGSLDGLLWVQHLDLSHNALRSVEGLEALQLLQSLDLAHNNISHSSGLSSLRLLPRLRRLSLTSNRLGARIVDTHTYLSTVHHTVDVPNIDGSSQMLQLVLGGMAGLKLNYLDLRDNVICREDGCEHYLRAIFPRTVIDF